MSVSSKIIVKLFKISNIKGKLGKGSNQTFEEAVTYNEKHPFILPKDKKAIYEERSLRGCA